MKKNSVSEFEMEREDFKIRLKRGAGSSGGMVAHDDAVVAYAPPLTALPPTGNPTPAAPSTAPAPATPAEPSAEIKSPMIGTFYRAPSPESAPYIEVGAEVGPDTVVCIIEAMKVMNEIKAETRGVITQILVENAKPVEFGQALFKLRPL